MGSSDTVLLKRWIERRDADSFAELVSRHSAMVYGTCRRILGNATEAEDIAQECFLRLSEAERPIEPSLGGWLHTLATRLSLSQLRSSKRRELREKRFAEEANSRSEMSWDDIETYVDEAIGELPEKLRYPIVHHFLEGQTYDAIAESLGIPPSTLASRVQKGVESIRKSLKRRGIPVSAVALAGMMASNAAEAIPASLAARLGKLALAGTGGSVVAGTVASGSGVPSKLIVTGGIAMITKKAVIGLGALLLLAVLGYSFHQRSGRRVIEEMPEAIPEAVKTPEADPAYVSEGDRPALQVEDRHAVATAAPTTEEEALVEEKPEIMLPASVSGYVTDIQEFPVQDVAVRLDLVDAQFGEDIRKTYTASTDSEGRYEIPDIDTFGYAKLYPIATGYVGRHPFSKELGVWSGMELENVNFVLTIAPYFISGWVVDQDNKSISDAEVSLTAYGYAEEDLASGMAADLNRGVGSWLFAATDVEGHFEIGVPVAGLCDFTVTKDGYGTGFFPQIMTGTENVVFVLRAAGSIAGTVRQTTGEPAQAARVEGWGAARRGGLEPDEAGPKWGTRHGPHYAITDTQGRYQIDGLGENFLYTVAAQTAARLKSTWEIEDDHSARMAREAAYGHTRDVRAISYWGGSASVRTNVRVQAGKTTSGVDLTVSAAPMRIHGTVTDAASGLPAHPLCVYALPEVYVVAEMGMRGHRMTMVAEDGNYSLQIDPWDHEHCNVGWCRPDIAGHWDDMASSLRDNTVATLAIEPGTEKELNFTVPALLTVPVRCLDENARPRPRLTVGVSAVGSDSMSGNTEETDADGRAVLVGVPPEQTFQVVAYEGTWFIDWTKVGESHPIIGTSGEALPEVRIVCPTMGGIEGLLCDAQGRPMGNTTFWSRALMADGTVSQKGFATTDADGVFCRPAALPIGNCAELYIWYERNGQFELAVVKNVRVLGNHITDLGTVTTQTTDFDDVAEILR